MAFFNIGNHLLKQKASTAGPMSMTSMMNSIRCMSSSKLFIGGLSWGTDDQSLKDAFASFGDVTEARVIMDRNTGKSRGFGFVEYNDTESASSAMSSMDGQELNGRNIRVSYATERQSGPRGGGGGGFEYGSGNAGGSGDMF